MLACMLSALVTAPLLVGGAAAASLGPRGFLENAGQFDERARYVSWHGFGITHVCVDGLRFSWKGGWNTFLTFEGANPWALVEAEGEHGERYHFFRGQDPSCWRTGVHAYDTVIWRDLYPGIDVMVRWSESGLEYDLDVSPGARLEDVVVRVDGVTEVEDLGEGGFVLETPVGVIRHGPPVSALIEEGGRRGVCSSLRRIDERRWGFALGGEAAERRASIDPVLEFATLLGGIGALDRAISAAYSSDGCVIVGGLTESPDFPVSPGAYSITVQNTDTYVVKLLVDGTGIVFGTFIGGSLDDFLTGMAVQGDGSVYLVGSTNSTGYPLSSGAVDTTFGGYWEGFVTRLAATGDALVFSTYLGGTDELLRDIAADAAGNAYVCGDASSPDYPVTPGAFDVAFNGPGDAIVTAINATGTMVLWSTFLGGTTGAEQAFGIDLDSAGSVYVCGWHGQGSGIPTSDFPVTPGAFQTTTAGGGQTEAFVTKFAPGGGSLAYSTFLVGYTTDRAYDIAVDFLGRACVAGETHSSNFPTTPGAFDPTFNSLIEGFVTKLSPDGSSLVWSTFLGGNGYDYLTGLDIDAAGSVVVSFDLTSTNMPTTPGALLPTYPLPGYMAGFLAKIRASGDALSYSTYLGGGGDVDKAYGVACGPGGRVACVGDTNSADFPFTPGALDTTVSGYADGFVTSFDLCGGTWQAHGAGCPGTAGVPVLAGSGCPQPGETLEVSITNGPSSALAFLLLAPAAATTPVTAWCALAIGPIVAPVVPLPLSPLGDLSFLATLPPQAPIGVIHVQVAILDSGAVGGVAASNALRVEIGY